MGVTFASFHELGTELLNREKLKKNAHNGPARSMDNSLGMRLLMPSGPEDLPNFSCLVYV